MGRSINFCSFLQLLAYSCVMFGQLVAGSSGVSSTCAPQSNRTNWAGNVVYAADCLQEATSVQKIRALVRTDAKVTVVGKRHCFTSIADNAYNQLSLLSMHKVVALDAAARTVTVDAGITYTQLCPWLDRRGFALHNLASLTDISIAGAISTATHGSGERNGNLASAVAALEIVTAAGDVVKLSRDAESFHGAVVGLGAVGVIARITLDIQPSYTVRQYVYQNLSLAKMRENFDTIMASGYSVSLFTDWQNQLIRQVGTYTIKVLTQRRPLTNSF